MEIEESELVTALRRAAGDLRKRLEVMEMERVSFVRHIADLRASHDREIESFQSLVRDLRARGRS